jgi:hypothetical protein
MRELDTGERATAMRKTASDSSMQYAKNVAAAKVTAKAEKSPGVVKKLIARSPFAKRSAANEVRPAANGPIITVLWV